MSYVLCIMQESVFQLLTVILARNIFPLFLFFGLGLTLQDSRDRSTLPSARRNAERLNLMAQIVK